MSADVLTVLKTADPRKILTKRVTRVDGEWKVRPYDLATWFTVRQFPVDDLASLGRVLTLLQRDSRDGLDLWLGKRGIATPERCCVIRGEPLPSTNIAHCRRLAYPFIDERKVEWAATFESKPRHWLAIDIDDLPVPEWNPDDLAIRRVAIRRDYAERNQPEGCPDHLLPWPLWRIDDEYEHDRDTADGIAGDGDPARISPTLDPELVIPAVAAHLPPEFANHSVFWSLTSSAGISQGAIRLRLWYWCDRPVADDEAKRWLADAPVDRSLYSPVQPHYTAAPIFDPPDIDPVGIRCGFWWRPGGSTVAVPNLAEPPAPEAIPVNAIVTGSWRIPASPDALCRRAELYAEAALRAVATASAGGRHPKLMAVAVRLFSLADRGLLDHGDVTRRLDSAAAAPLSSAERLQRCTSHGGRLSHNQDAIAWARARAQVAPDLPEGF